MFLSPTTVALVLKLSPKLKILILQIKLCFQNILQYNLLIKLHKSFADVTHSITHVGRRSDNKVVNGKL